MVRAWLLVAAVGLSGCGAKGGADATLPCKPKDRECALKVALAHPIKSKAFWQEAFAKPVEERIGPAPAGLVQFLALDNIAQGFDEVPRAGAPSPEFVAEVRQAFAEIPAAVKRPLAAKLAGIYFVDNMGGTGFTDQINGKDGIRGAGFILLDAQVLRERTANSWASWRDGTPFKPDACCKLEETLEEAAQDNRKNAIQYILLHELAHVLAIDAAFHPDWNTPPDKIGPTSRFPFFELSWSVPPASPRYASRFDDAWPLRTNIVYYQSPKLAGNEMVAAYEALEKTNFATLYGATSPGDDFAEAFANYVHVVMMGKPFEIRLTRDGQVAKRYRACWGEARCAEKRKLLEALLDVR